MPNPLIELAATNVLLPAGIGLAAGRFARRLPARTQPLAAAVGAVAAVVTASTMALGAPELIPMDADGWLVHAVALGAAVAAVGRRRAASATAGAVACAAAISAPALRAGGATASLLAGAILGAALLSAGAWSAGHMDRQLGPRRAILVHGIWMASAAAAALVSGTLRVGQFGVVAAAAAGGLWAASLGSRPPRLSVGPVWAFAAWAVTAVAHTYASLPTPAALLLCTPPIAASLLLRRAPERPTSACAVAAVVAIAAAAIAAVAGMPDTAAGSQLDYGYGP